MSVTIVRACSPPLQRQQVRFACQDLWIKYPLREILSNRQSVVTCYGLVSSLGKELALSFDNPFSLPIQTIDLMYKKGVSV